MIKWIFFDLDGVLIDSREWHFEAFQLALQDEGLSIDPEEHAREYEGLPTSFKLKSLASKYHLSQEKVWAIEKLKKHYTREILTKNISTNAKLIELLKTLRSSGIKFAVCSNAIRETVEMCLAKQGVKDFFEFYLSNEDIISPKPSPEIYLKALKMSGEHAINVLIIEDSARGVEAAESSGCQTLRVNSSADLSLEKIMSCLGHANG